MRPLRKDSRVTLSEPVTKACLPAAFFLPVLILLVIAWRYKLYPFSSSCFATEHLQNTYFPVIAELRRKLLSGDSLFYTWNAGGGSNFLATIGSFAASPFVLLYLLFPADAIPKVTQIIFALKAACASLAFFLLLWKKENTVSPLTVAMSTAYALCGYVMTYSQEPWMLDIVILLPLLILSLYCLILGKHIWTFSLMCALTGFTCAKSGVYMIVFIFACFPLLYIEARYEKDDLRRFRGIIKDFFITLFLGVGLSAFMWYPSLRALWDSAAGKEVLHIPEDLTMDLKVWDILERACFDPSVIFPSDATQFPSVYCGILPVILVILYGFSSRIHFTEKVYHYCMLVMLYISMSSKILQFVFHGLHFPISGQYPQAILITFLLMCMGGRLIAKPSWYDDKNHVYTAIGILITFMLIRSAITDLSYSDFAIYTAIALLIVYFTAIFKEPTLSGKYRTLVVSLLAVVMAAECYLSIYRPLKEKYYHEVFEKDAFEKDPMSSMRVDPAGVTRNSEEEKKKKKVYKLDNTVLYKEQEEDGTKMLLAAESAPSGSRILVDSPYLDNYNYGLLYGFPTLSTESYLVPSVFSQSLRALGINRSEEDSAVFAGNGTAITDALFNQACVVGEGKGAYGIKDLKETAGCGFFFVSEEIYDSFVVSESPFENQNELAWRMTNQLPLTVLSMDVLETENMKKKADGSFSAVEQGKKGKVVLESKEPLTSSYDSIYIYYSSSQTVNIEVYLQDDEVEIPLPFYGYQANDCIRVDLTNAEGKKLYVCLNLYSPDEGSIYFYAAAVHTDRMRAFEKKLSESAWNLISYEDGSLVGNIEAPQSGNLILSVPSDAGWSATIDGQKTETFAAFQTFLAIHVPEGHHEVKLHYSPVGFTDGARVSIGSAVLLVLFAGSQALADRKTKKKKENKEDTIMVNEEEQA